MNHKDYLYNVNIFVIPSWYPSDSNPIYGTFVKEQIEMMAAQDGELTFGVSKWGQGDDPFLLYARQPLRSLRKMMKNHHLSQFQESSNLHSYFTPSFTWTRRWRNGNLRGIIAANRSNLQRFIEKHGTVDVLHVQASWPGAWIAQQLSQEFGIPYIVTIRMSPFPFAQFLDKNGRLDKELQQGLNASNLMIATSQSLKNRLTDFGFTPVEVVNNPVDVSLFCPSRTISRNISSTVKLLAVGRLEYQKGFDVLINAMTKLESKYILEIVGDGSLYHSLKDQIKSNQLQDRVKLNGRSSRQEVADKMRTCDLFILSSRHETFGNVILEAMACGKPVVSTDCGGPQDIVTDKTGIFCKVDDMDSLVEAIKQATERDWNVTEIRADVMNRFSPAVFTRKMKEIYQRVAISKR